MKKFLLVFSFVFVIISVFAQDGNFKFKMKSADTVINVLNDSTLILFVADSSGGYTLSYAKDSAKQIKNVSIPPYIWLCIVGIVAVLIFLVVLWKGTRKYKD